MATHTPSIFPLMPDASGNVYPTVFSALTGTTNDFWKHEVLVFADSGTDIYASGVFRVPQNYVGSAAFKVAWNGDNVVTGKVVWGLSYRTLVADGSLDQATAEEAVSNPSGTTVSGTADGLNLTAIGSPTAGNFTAGDFVEVRLERLGTDADDTMAEDAVAHDLYFEYADV